MGKCPPLRSRLGDYLPFRDKWMQVNPNTNLHPTCFSKQAR